MVDRWVPELPDPFAGRRASMTFLTYNTHPAAGVTHHDGRRDCDGPTNGTAHWVKHLHTLPHHAADAVRAAVRPGPNAHDPSQGVRTVSDNSDE